MKIFALSSTFGYKAGYEKSFIQYLRAFRALSHKVTVFYDEKTQVPDEFDFEEYKISGLHRKPFDSKSESGIEKLSQKLQLEKPDIVFLNHVENPDLMDWLASQKTSRVIRRIALHDLYCLNGNKVLTRSDKTCSYSFGWRCLSNTYSNGCATRRPDRLLQHFEYVRKGLHATRQFAHVIVPSQYMNNVAVQNGIPPERISLIAPYYALPSEKSTDERYVLFVGRIAPSKGVDYLLRAFTAVPPAVKLIIIGDGKSLNSCRDLASDLKLNDRVEFKGYLPPADVQEYQRRCSFLAFPAIWQEPFGITATEAMAWGKPVISFDIGGMSDFVRNGVSGYLIPRKNIEQLSQRMNELIQNEALRLKMGQTAREIVRSELSEEAFIIKISNMLEKAKISK